MSSQLAEAVGFTQHITPGVPGFFSPVRMAIHFKLEELGLKTL